MFTRISGTIAERGDDRVLIDVGGLGYEIVLPPCVDEKVPRTLGERVTLDVYPVLAIDGNAARYTFFGFGNAVEREFFEALISVASIGPKTAARAFSLPMGRIAQAIDAGDHQSLVVCQDFFDGVLQCQPNRACDSDAGRRHYSRLAHERNDNGERDTKCLLHATSLSTARGVLFSMRVKVAPMRRKMVVSCRSSKYE